MAFLLRLLLLDDHSVVPDQCRFIVCVSGCPTWNQGCVQLSSISLWPEATSAHLRWRNVFTSDVSHQITELVFFKLRPIKAKWPWGSGSRTRIRPSPLLASVCRALGFGLLSHSERLFVIPPFLTLFLSGEGFSPQPEVTEEGWRREGGENMSLGDMRCGRTLSS